MAPIGYGGVPESTRSASEIQNCTCGTVSLASRAWSGAIAVAEPMSRSARAAAARMSRLSS